jgi:hypothetical protein
MLELAVALVSVSGCRSSPRFFEACLDLARSHGNNVHSAFSREPLPDAEDYGDSLRASQKRETLSDALRAFSRQSQLPFVSVRINPV